MTVDSLGLLKRPLIVGLLVCSVTASTLACSKSQADSDPTDVPAARAAEAEMPEQILGLGVIQEDISSDIAEVRSATYISSVALFSFREGDLLQASLQVASLNNLAKPNLESFRNQVAALMGGSSLEELRVGTYKVYMTSGQQQIVYTWFKGRGYYVLTVRRAYPFRRTLLRKLLDLEEPV